MDSGEYKNNTDSGAVKPHRCPVTGMKLKR